MNRRSWRARLGATLVALPTALGTGAVRAADVGAPEDGGLENLLDVQVESASRYAQSSFDAPASVHTTTREEAMALGHMTMGDMLDRLPGLYIATDRDYSRIGVRGFERPGDWGSRLLVTVDGLRINDPTYGQALPETEFPVVAEWIKRLEYVPGPGGSVYGDNALFGVVNAVTLQGADAPGLRLRSSAGRGGNGRMVAQYGWRDGDADVFVGLAGQHSDGELLDLPEFASPGNPRGRTGLRDAEDYTALLAKVRLGDWQWLATGTWREQQFVTAPFATAFGQAGRYRDGALYSQLAWDAGWQDDLRPSVRAIWGQGKFVGHYPYEGDPPVDNVDDTDTRWVGLDARVQWRGWTNHMLVAGVEATRVYAASLRNFNASPYESVLDRDVQSTTAGVFVQDAWQLAEQFVLTSGLRLDRLALGDTRVSPRLALVMRPDANQAYKLSAGRAYRAPNLAERFYDDGGVSQVSNPDLGSERIETVQASWERALGPSTLMTLGVYRTSLRQLIELTEGENGIWRYENIGSAHARGIEFDVVHRAESAWQWRFNLAWQRAQAHGAPLSNTPRWVAKGHLISPVMSGWQAGIEADAITAREDGTSRVAGRVQWNANLAWKGWTDQEIGLHIVNAGNAASDDPAALDNELTRVPRPRRHVWLDWRIAF